MLETLEDLKSWAGGLIRAEAAPPLWMRVPWERVDPKPFAQQLTPSDDYFCVRVCNMHLTYDREWLEEYQPLLLVAVEFSYDGEGVTKPAVIGPQLIERLGAAAPQATAIAGTVVAGPHPLREGSVTVTLALQRVLRRNVASGFLDVIEGAGKALNLAAGIAPFAALARVVTDGVSALTSAEGPVMARRDEFLPAVPGYFALIAPTAAVDLNQVGVIDGVLMEQRNGSVRPFRRADYVLYSIEPVGWNSIDVTRLPLYRQWLTVLSEANKAATPHVWESAKTNLSTLIAMAFASPDLTYGHAEVLESAWTDKAQRRRDSARRLGELGEKRPSEAVTEDTQGTSRHELPEQVRDRALAVLDL
ncbi:hypothetical protein EV649_5090 [Kribbella sp. VKM Ac-2569]|uniref:hypothetical protein n=1 Tax=Kribbella sp. VKM Ac-2569 TaxID=2512220 RepID=UPI00102C2712|nr:hypothetical protein [Kribbella sp. VKM Ac-2569]RZT17542.1 hypothetical protein EV649_5090 [Kribbella sp. VKM Ac-2569]